MPLPQLNTSTKTSQTLPYFCALKRMKLAVRIACLGCQASLEHSKKLLYKTRREGSLHYFCNSCSLPKSFSLLKSPVTLKLFNRIQLRGKNRFTCSTPSLFKYHWSKYCLAFQGLWGGGKGSKDFLQHFLFSPFFVVLSSLSTELVLAGESMQMRE